MWPKKRGDGLSLSFVSFPTAVVVVVPRATKAGFRLATHGRSFEVTGTVTSMNEGKKRKDKRTNFVNDVEIIKTKDVLSRYDYD